MSSLSIENSSWHRDGLSNAGRHIGRAIGAGQGCAVAIVQVHDIERLCAAVGHEHAAEILNDFHDQLGTIARDKDAIERIADRKFAVLLGGLRNRGHASLAANKIERLAGDTIIDSSDKFKFKISIGIALCPENANDAAELLRLAEIASLDGQRKHESVCFYEKEAAREIVNDWGLESRLDNALKSGDLELHYQAKVSLSTDKIVGAEGLMRWSEPELGTIPPDVFVALAESTGRILDLTQFAIQCACRHVADWRRASPDLGIAINVTPSIIQTREIIDVVRSAMGIWGVSPKALTLEVTENALLEDREASHAVLTELRQLGIRVSLDDFGTGYSSFAYLKDIPADELKIDRSFVMGMSSDQGDRKIVEHTIDIAKSFGLSVVAEGVENQQVLDELRRLGCDFGQGYFISRPVPAGEFEALLKHHQK